MFCAKASLTDYQMASNPVVSNWYDANITGILTGCMIVIATTYASFAGISAVVSGVANVAGGVAQAVGTTVAATTTTALATSDADQVTSLINTIDESDLETFIAANIDDLNQQQVSAAAQVVGNLINTTQSQVSNQNLYDIDALQNYANQRTNEIENLLRSPELVNRLQAQ